MHEHKWTTAPHDGWAVEKVIIDYANQQIKQVWKKLKPDMETDDQPTPKEHCLTQPIGDGQPEAPPIESEKQKGKALKSPAASMKSWKKGMKAAAPMKTAKKVNKVKKAKAAAPMKTAKKVNKVKKAKK